jgi:hypothetical protein
VRYARIRERRCSQCRSPPPIIHDFPDLRALSGCQFWITDFCCRHFDILKYMSCRSLAKTCLDCNSVQDGAAGSRQRDGARHRGIEDEESGRGGVYGVDSRDVGSGRLSCTAERLFAPRERGKKEKAQGLPPPYLEGGPGSFILRITTHTGSSKIPGDCTCAECHTARQMPADLAYFGRYGLFSARILLMRLARDIP